jgi:hypothetical protein
MNKVGLRLCTSLIGSNSCAIAHLLCAPDSIAHHTQRATCEGQPLVVGCWETLRQIALVPGSDGRHCILGLEPRESGNRPPGDAGQTGVASSRKATSPLKRSVTLCSQSVRSICPRTLACDAAAIWSILLSTLERRRSLSRGPVLSERGHLTQK